MMAFYLNGIWNMKYWCSCLNHKITVTFKQVLSTVSAYVDVIVFEKPLSESWLRRNSSTHFLSASASILASWCRHEKYHKRDWTGGICHISWLLSGLYSPRSGCSTAWQNPTLLVLWEWGEDLIPSSLAFCLLLRCRYDCLSTSLLQHSESKGRKDIKWGIF